MSKTIGIDLGTTNSVVAILERGEPKVIVNDEGDRVTPSVVAWDDKGEVLVGQIAKRQAVTNPENTVFSAKRWIGRRADEGAEEAKRVPYKVVARDNGDAAVSIRGKMYSPPEISAHVLRKLKRAAESHLGEEVTKAVITVPAYFNDAQRQATKDAGKIAGLEVERIVNEPTAAALAYGLDKKDEQTIAVYDFGGGTFDISILEVGDGVVQVISTGGDTHLGGDDVDEEIVKFLIAEFRKDQGVDVSDDKMVLQRLRDAAEKAKKELSSRAETTINLPFLTANASGPKHLEVSLSRAKLEQMIQPLIDRTMKAVKQALADAKKKPADVTEVVLVGGSTRIPAVQETVKKFFGREPHKGVNPDEVVAAGAAVQAGVLTGDVKDVLLLDVTPLSLGVETLGGVMTTLIARNTTIPAKKEEIFSTADDNQPNVDVHVLQGERAQAADNRTLGRFKLEGIEPAPRGMAKIVVTFDIDANGILNVTAKDQSSGKEKKITVTAGSGLSEAEINKMVEDAKTHEAEDNQRRRETEERNRADHLCYEAEKVVNEHEAKLGETLVKETRELISEVREAIEKRDASRLTGKVPELQTKLSEVMQNAQGPSESGAPPAQENKNDDVIDADFEDVA